jgi:hypothetical protein
MATKKKATTKALVSKATPTRKLDEAAALDIDTADADEGDAEETDVETIATNTGTSPAGAPSLEAAGRPRLLRKMSIPELQALFRAMAQRDTTSTSRTYLIHQIKEAKAGRVRIGPARSREKQGPMVHLPLRMRKDDVPVLDEVWERHGLESRSELFRRALHKELGSMGEDAAAALFAGAEEEG